MEYGHWHAFVAQLVPPEAFSHPLRRAIAETAWQLGQQAAGGGVAGGLAKRGLFDQAMQDELWEVYRLLGAGLGVTDVQYAYVLRELWAHDELKRLAAKVAALPGSRNATADELAAKARAEFEAFEQARHLALQAGGVFVPSLEATTGAIQRMQRAAANQLAGNTTGFRLLDVITGGMQAGHLWVIGARTSHGKSALALDISVGAQDTGAALWFSMEMGQDELRGRLIARESGVSERTLRTKGGMNSQDSEAIAKAAAWAASFPLLCDETSAPTVQHVRSVAREMARKHKLSCVIVDNLQLMTTGRAESKRVGYEDITRQLKALARDLKLPVLLLVQLSRGVEREGRAPGLVDLRDSGSIEQDADVVLLIQRWERGTGELGREPARLVVAKGRGSGTGNVKAWFHGPRTSFQPIGGSEEQAWDEAVVEAAARMKAEAAKTTKKLKGRREFGGRDA
jgi:replicative DNA helicase